MRGIDDDGAGRLVAGVGDDLPLQARIELGVGVRLGLLGGSVLPGVGGVEGEQRLRPARADKAAAAISALSEAVAMNLVATDIGGHLSLPDEIDCSIVRRGKHWRGSMVPEIYLLKSL